MYLRFNMNAKEISCTLYICQISLRFEITLNQSKSSSPNHPHIALLFVKIWEPKMCKDFCSDQLRQFFFMTILMVSSYRLNTKQYTMFYNTEPHTHTHTRGGRILCLWTHTRCIGRHAGRCQVQQRDCDSFNQSLFFLFRPSPPPSDRSSAFSYAACELTGFCSTLMNAFLCSVTSTFCVQNGAEKSTRGQGMHCAAVLKLD